MANYAYACVNTYATNRSQPLLLQCCKCGQNVHEPCLKGLLGIEVAHLSSANVMTLINPLKIPSLHFFCHRCSDTNIPQSTDGLKKSALTKSKNETPKTNINVHVNVDNSTEKNLPEMQISLVDKQIDNSHAALEKNVEPVVEVSKVCSFYKRGICKHGKKGSECRFSHPSYCKPLLMHGTHPVHGCIKGKECTDLHPKMCYSSLNKKQCFNEKCPFFHVKGTKRQHSSSRSKLHYKTNQQEHPSANSTYSNGADNFVRNGSNNNSNSPDFLYAIDLLRKDLFQALDSKMSTMASSLKQTMGSLHPNYLSPLDIPQSNQNQNQPQFQYPLHHPVATYQNPPQTPPGQNPMY